MIHWQRMRHYWLEIKELIEGSKRPKNNPLLLQMLDNFMLEIEAYQQYFTIRTTKKQTPEWDEGNASGDIASMFEHFATLHPITIPVELGEWLVQFQFEILKVNMDPKSVTNKPKCTPHEWQDKLKIKRINGAIGTLVSYASEQHQTLGDYEPETNTKILAEFLKKKLPPRPPLKLKLATTQEKWKKLENLKDKVDAMIEAHTQQHRSGCFSFFRPVPSGLIRLKAALAKLADTDAATLAPFAQTFNNLNSLSNSIADTFITQAENTKKKMNLETKTSGKIDTTQVKKFDKEEKSIKEKQQEISDDYQIWEYQFEHLLKKSGNEKKIKKTMKSIDQVYRECQSILDDKMSHKPNFGTRKKATAEFYEDAYSTISPEKYRKLNNKFQILKQLYKATKEGKSKPKLGYRWLFLPNKQPQHQKMIHKMLTELPHQLCGNKPLVLQLWENVKDCLISALAINSSKITDASLKNSVLDLCSRRPDGKPSSHIFPIKRHPATQEWYQKQFNKFISSNPLPDLVNESNTTAGDTKQKGLAI